MSRCSALLLVPPALLLGGSTAAHSSAARGPPRRPERTPFGLPPREHVVVSALAGHAKYTEAAVSSHGPPPPIAIAHKCGARPGAPDSVPPYCCAAPTTLTEDVAFGPGVFPKRFHDFLIETGEISGKCTALQEDWSRCTNLQATCKTGGPKAAPQHAVSALLEDAKRYKPVFDAMLDAMLARIPTGEAQASKAGNKKGGRCVEKIDQKYGCGDQYGARQLSDVVRGSLVFTHEDALCAFINKTLSPTGAPHGVIQLRGGSIVAAGTDPKTGEAYRPATLEITNYKNRFASDAGGMRDFLVNVRMRIQGDPWGHISEVQLHHSDQVQAKHHFHCVYAYLRRIDEARRFLKVPDEDIFCDDAARCGKYWIDHRNPQKKGPPKSALEIMQSKWLADTDSDETRTTRRYWSQLVQPFLRQEYQVVTNSAQIASFPNENSIDRTVRRGGKPFFTGKHGGLSTEHALYLALKGAMVESYDRAACEIFDDCSIFMPKGLRKEEKHHCTQRLALPVVAAQAGNMEMHAWPDTASQLKGKGPKKETATAGLCLSAIQDVGLSCSKVDPHSRSFAVCKPFFDACMGLDNMCTEHVFRAECTPGYFPRDRVDCMVHTAKCESATASFDTCTGALKEWGSLCSDKAYMAGAREAIHDRCRDFYQLCALNICDMLNPTAATQAGGGRLQEPENQAEKSARERALAVASVAAMGSEDDEEMFESD